jgi:hypothetical protein
MSGGRKKGVLKMSEENKDNFVIQNIIEKVCRSPH